RRGDSRAVGLRGLRGDGREDRALADTAAADVQRHAEQLVYVREDGDARGHDRRTRAVDVVPAYELPRRRRLDDPQRLLQLGVTEPAADEPPRRTRAAADCEGDVDRGRLHVLECADDL